jgi:predicted DNA-binding ribbon-helix-helix protein
MLNWLASAVILQETYFTGLSEIQQCEAEELQLAAFLPTMDDERQLKNDLSSLISKVAHEFLPQLQFLHKKAAVSVAQPDLRPFAPVNLSRVSKSPPT